MNRRRGESTLPRIVVGLTVLSAGVIFWLDRIGSIEARDYMIWWPVAVIAMGLAHLAERRWAAAGVWLVVGAFFALPLIGMPHVAFWRIIGMWPLLISVAGITLILQSLRRGANPPAFRAVAVMAGNVRKVGSDHFTGGEAVAVMGGCEIDLGAAKVTGEATIDVLAFWGGIEIRVPKGWHVVGRVAEVLGGYEDKTASAPENAPRLIVRGSAIMGGVEVKNVRETE